MFPECLCKCRLQSGQAVRDSQQHWTHTSTAVAKVACAANRSLDPALRCLLMGAEPGCPFGNDRLESS